MPLVLVNADAALLLSQQARCCRSRDGSRSASPATPRDGDGKAVVTGNPVRAEIEAMPRRPSASPAAAARCACWSSAAAWARGC